MTTGASRQPDPSLPPSQGRSSGPKRSRTRTLIPLAVAAWVVLEIWLLILVADVAGGLSVFLLLVAGAVLGGIVIKRAGRRAWRSLATRVQSGGVPGRMPEGDNAGNGGNTVPMLGGLLIMLPGLLSDAAGLLCLFPPTGALLRRSAERSLERRMNVSAPGSVEDTFRQARMHRPDGKIVQGEVVRDDDEGGRPAGGHSGEPPLTG